MRDKLLYSMAMDLGIEKFENENEFQYIERILYSAIACHIKAASIDCPLTEGLNSSNGVSRRYVSDKCSEIMEQILSLYSECKIWFDTDCEKEKAVNIIRERLLRHGDLVNVGFDTNIALAKYHYTQLTERIGTVKGTILQQGNNYSGIATICKTSSTQPIVSSIQTVDKWIDEFIHCAWWANAELSKDSVQYFNPLKKSVNNLCWQDSLPTQSNKVVLARRTVNKSLYEYFLYKPSENKIHRIDPFLKEQGEHRRFMIGLKAMNGNPVSVYEKRFFDHVLLKLKTYLPRKETTLLESYAWPYNSILDKLEWNMSFEVWEYIKPYMTGVGLKIEEVNNG